MKVRLHDRSYNPTRVYVVESKVDCRGALDADVYSIGCEFNDVIKMGDVIGEPEGLCYVERYMRTL